MSGKTMANRPRSAVKGTPSSINGRNRSKIPADEGNRCPQVAFDCGLGGHAFLSPRRVADDRVEPSGSKDVRKRLLPVERPESLVLLVLGEIGSDQRIAQPDGLA